MRILATISLIITSLPTFGQSKLTGYYSSNVAEIGFFVTRIQLNNDSTFKYEFSGDLLYNKGTGKYWVDHKAIVHLDFDKETLRPLEEAISGNAMRPSRLRFRHGRLYQFKEDGQLVKRSQGYSRHKKFLLFGDHYMTSRRMFLKKRKGSLVWRMEKMPAAHKVHNQ